VEHYPNADDQFYSAGQIPGKPDYMKLVSIVVDELPESCWQCDFRYNDEFVYRCPLMEKEFFSHVAIDEYKKERHPDCPLKEGRF
jgi:hypothetical protein